MDTQLIVNINGTFQRLDLFQDIPITLTIQQSDLTKLTDKMNELNKYKKDLLSKTNKDLWLDDLIMLKQKIF